MSFEIVKSAVKRNHFIPRHAMEEVGGPSAPQEVILHTGGPAISLLTDYLNVLSKTADSW